MEPKKSLTAKELGLYLGCKFRYDNDVMYTVAGIQDAEVINALGHFHDIKLVKPILRKLESMTEDEVTEVFKLKWRVQRSDHEWISIKFKRQESVFLNPGWSVEAVYKQNGKERTMLGTLSMSVFEPLSFQYLLSKSFDLFGWIDAGLALDQNEMKK